MLAKDIREKHKKNDRCLSIRICEYLDCYGISNYREAKKLLNNKVLC